MPLEASDIDHIYTQIALGTPKDQCPFPLDEEGSAFWDELEPQVAELREQGFDFDMLAPEIPDLPPWVAQAPEAKAPPAPPPPAGPDDVPSVSDTGRPPPPPEDDGE